jgi:uncharacterized membrane-anchored protein YitT (DUF2179 family)
MTNLKSALTKISIKTYLKDSVFIILGVCMAAIGLKGFILPNNFLDGGAMGVSLLLEMVTQINLSYLIVLVNLPFIMIGAKQISIEFAIKSIIAILALAIVVNILTLPDITSDKLLISLFGGFFLGAGIGLTIRGGGVIDGTEVLAITVSRKSSLTVGDVIAMFNILLFCSAVFLIGLETAMYSILTYFSASKTVDFVINGIEEYLGVIIVSENAEDIKHHISKNLGRGVTVFKSDKGYGSRGEFGEEGIVLFCVVTRLEVSKLLLEIEKIDPTAFVVQHSIKETKGGMIKKRPLH